jgi:hypothetical protein
LTLGLSAAAATTSLVSNFLNYPKADVIERRRFIGAERIIAVTLDPVEDRPVSLALGGDFGLAEAAIE